MSTHTHPSTDLERQHPVDDPGLEPHAERYIDSDERLGRAANRQVVALFGLSPLLALAATVVYFAIPRDLEITFIGFHTPAHHFWFGLLLGSAILLIGLGAVHWARTLMSDVEMIEERHPIASSEEDRAGILAEIDKGIADTGLSRRKMILASMGGALGLFAVPMLVTLADLGPWPTRSERARTIERTLFAEATPSKPVRLVNDTTWAPIRAADLEIGQLVNAQPENLKNLHGTAVQVEKSKAAIIIVRMAIDKINIPESRKDWHVDGILCYSKICTHVGCPISLWEQQTHHLLCPCHQSTFDLGDSGVVVFGPAARALPQLPITVNEAGELVAHGDFTVPVGPSYFERDSRNDYQKGDN
ncbi:MAG: Rieske 2Fe-2S domain-containing protein [Propionibacterium sp.]|nr:Rieske 2Fe-2S domain-containing protein [Propionibacterium sp.]